MPVVHQNHFVNSKEHERALREGTPIVALCGHEWVPEGKPLGPNTCTECLRIYIETTGAGCRVNDGSRTGKW